MLAHHFARSILAAVIVVSCTGLASAQQVTGTLGSPSATTAISNKQLPAPDPKFGGVIKNDALQSKPWWAPRIVPPKGAERAPDHQRRCRIRRAVVAGVIMPRSTARAEDATQDGGPSH